MMPNNTPMTKSQTVMQTMMLMIVIYSFLWRKEIRSEQARIINRTVPARTMPGVPYSFLYKIKTKNENQSPNNHNRYDKDSVEYATSDHLR